MVSLLKSPLLYQSAKLIFSVFTLLFYYFQIGNCVSFFGSDTIIDTIFIQLQQCPERDCPRSPLKKNDKREVLLNNNMGSAYELNNSVNNSGIIPVRAEFITSFFISLGFSLNFALTSEYQLDSDCQVCSLTVFYQLPVIEILKPQMLRLNYWLNLVLQ